MSEVSPMQPAAMMTPKTAAASSRRTTLVLGSRLCITAPENRTESFNNSQIHLRSQYPHWASIFFKLRNEIEITPVPGGHGPSPFGTAVYVTLQNSIS